MSQKFTVTEIYINNVGEKIKLTWDYFDRLPTAEEKEKTKKSVDKDNFPIDKG